MYIPKLSAITDNPSPRTSDSESAFSMIANDDNIGDNTSYRLSLDIGFSRSMSAMYGENE